MANRRRGEIDACLNGKTYTLCLTLGMLAELEDIFAAKDLVALAERFSQGRISSLEAITIITLGLRGAGHVVDRDDVAAMPIENGAAGAVKIVSELLAATFGVEEDTTSFDADAPTLQGFDAHTSNSFERFGADAPNRGEAPRP